MNGRVVIEITRKEQEALKEFLKVLQRERDSIISFSLEGIIQENNRKEEILRKLEYLKSEKGKILELVDDDDEVFRGDAWKSLTADIEHVMTEIRIALQKNMKLLSFSIDHVKSSIDHIIGFINSFNYGKKQEQSPLLLSRVI
ncbi:MAG TPA: flagellar export chaperone FlgN [Syntrophorhabdaceae bacterium]|nr:flagellar export chaperone FlgN [Syntrophorhabdaceae bacterium]